MTRDEKNTLIEKMRNEQYKYHRNASDMSLDEKHRAWNDGKAIGLRIARQMVKDMPEHGNGSGRWLSAEEYGDVECSECGEQFNGAELGDANYCPQCGAKMAHDTRTLD